MWCCGAAQEQHTSRYIQVPLQQRLAAVRTAQVQSASRYIQVPSQQRIAAVRTAQVQSTSRYIQVPSQRDQLLLPGGQSLRIGGWSFASESGSATSSGY